MANYPSSPPSFTQKSAGQTIEESHVNDLQDEVTAVGAALVNGNISHDLTPSTNSTRSLGTDSRRWRSIYGTTGIFDRLESTSLSVVGNSTVGNLSVSSGTTLANVTITGDITSTGAYGSSGARIKEIWVGQLNASSGGDQGSTFSSPVVISTAAPASPSTNAIYEDSIIKAWAVFSSTPAISRGVNVSSATASGSTGHDFAFATALEDSNYAVVGVSAVSKATTGFHITDNSGLPRGNFVVVG